MGVLLGGPVLGQEAGGLGVTGGQVQAVAHAARVEVVRHGVGVAAGPPLLVL